MAGALFVVEFVVALTFYSECDRGMCDRRADLVLGAYPFVLWTFVALLVLSVALRLLEMINRS